MIDVLLWVIPIIALLGGIWWGLVEQVLANGSRTLLLEAIAARGGGDTAWIKRRPTTLIRFAALKRMGGELLVILGVVYHVAGLPTAATFTPGRVITALFVGVFVSWLCTSVVAGALARHGGQWLLVRTLPLLRLGAIGARMIGGLVTMIDEIVRRLSGAAPIHPDAVRRTAEIELLRSIEESQRGGALDEIAVEMLENVVEFRTTDVGEVMTPRTDIEGIASSDGLAEIRVFIAKAGHSRIPVYEEDIDHIVGILYVKDLVPYLGEDAKDFSLGPLLRQSIVVPETKPVRELLSDFQRSEVHMAIVLDEFGGTAGLVTIEDVLEEIVGEIHDEHEPDDEEEPMLVRITDYRSEVDGRYHLDDLNEALGLTLPEDNEYDTVGGFVLARLGRVPAVGEAVEVEGVRLVTIAASPTHIQRLRVETVDSSTI